jgi:adenylate cyclase
VPDWAADGLLEGLEGEEREARAELLDQLHDAGVSIDELRDAVKEQRLALLPVERVLGGDYTFSAREVAEQAGVPLDFLLEQRRALGLPSIGPDEKGFNEDDVEAAHEIKQFLDAGFEPDAVLEVTRVVGEGLRRVADTVSDQVARVMLQPGVTERDLGMRYAQAARELGPMMGRRLEYVFKLQLRELVRNEMVSRAELVSGEVPGSETVTVSFADLVGFTKLGEELPAEEIGRLAGRLGQLASDVVEPPVRLVKTIGDAAMLVSHETEPLVHATIDLVRAADDAEENFPQLRSGIAVGEAIGRGGDWYGRPVNLASRVTGIARPGSVLTTSEVRAAAEDSFRWSFAGRRRLKGVKEPQPLFRVREQAPD